MITQTTAADFGASCAVTTNVSVSNASGGEVRLASTVEDYFDGTTVNSSRWVMGSTYDWYTVPPSVAGGLLTLDAAYLRSQVGFNQTTPVRFFEARAVQRINSNSASWPDLGFYRALPPLAYGSGPYPNDSSLRIFVTRDTNTTFIRGRDGDASNPLTDVDIPTVNLTQYHNFRIEWDASESRFYIDGVFQGTIAGSSALNTWVFLYSQDPSTSNGGRSPMQIDWVRAGAYPANGTYTSCVQDAGQVVTWATLASTGNAPANTGISFSTRTSLDGNNWTNWLPVSNGNIASPAGRYLQYRIELSSSNVLVSPEVQQVSLSYQPVSATPTNTPVPPTATNTPTNTPIPPTATNTATNTPLPPTATNTPTNTPVSPTATNTATNTPVPPTATNTPTNTPVSPTATNTATNTPLPPTATNTPTSTPTFTPTPLAGLIFADGFELGNLAAWSANTTDGGDLSAAPAAALIGTNGLQAVLDDNNSIYVTDDTPASESRYRVRFYFDPNSITMTNGNAHYLFYGYTGTSTVVTRVEFRRSSSLYQLRAALRNDSTTFTTTSWFTISDAPHSIELDWRASSGAGANNGGLTLWIDGTQQANLTGTDNDTRRIDRVQLGAVAGVDSGTRGTYYFDSFESRRQDYIGPVVTPTPVPPTATNTPVPPTSTPTSTNTPVPATATSTNTPMPPTPTATATNTPVPATATNTPVPSTGTPTSTPVPPTATNTPTNTPVPPTATSTPTNTPVPPTATNTPVPPTATNTPIPASNFALSFDGVNDVLSAGQTATGSALTVEGWVRPTSSNADGLVMVQSDDTNGWSLELNSGRVTWWLSTNLGWRSVQHSTALQAGQWYHVAVTYNSGTAQVFVNGIGSTATNVGTLTQGPSLQVGGFSGYPYFNGTVDEVRVSNVVRYSANFSVPAAPFVSDANTVDLWQFNEGSGQVAADIAGTANNGTLGTGSGTDTADPAWVAGYPFGSMGLLSVALEPQSTNYSLRFYGHGVNDIDRVKIPIDPQVPADVGGDFTLEFWMKADSGNNSGSCSTGSDNWITGNIILDRDVFNSGDYGDYGVSLRGGKIAFGVHNGSSGAGICSTATLNNGQWYHVAVTRNSSTGQLRIFIDGVLSGQGSGPTGDLSYRDGRSTSHSDDPYLVIGAEKHDVGSQYPAFKGWVDEVRISNSLRYSNNFTRPTQPFVTDGNTAALYHFDEGPAGSCTGMILDSSGASGGPSNGVCRFGGSGNAGPVYSTDIPFTVSEPDTTAPVITNVSAGPLDTIAVISWTTDDPATSRVDYETGGLTQSKESSELVTSHQLVLTGLSPQTTYNFQVISKNGADLETTDPSGPVTHSFSTLAAEDILDTYLPLIMK